MVNSVEISQINEFLASPERIGLTDLALLESYIKRYPYFQPLRLLLAKATLGSAEENNTLATAALYTNGALLHNLIHEPEDLLDTHFIYEPAVADAEPMAIDEDGIDEVSPEEESAPQAYEQEETVAEEHEVFEEIAEVDVHNYQNIPTPVEEPAEDEVFEEISEFYSEAFSAEVIPPVEDPGQKEDHNAVAENIAEEPAAVVNEDARLEHDLVLENIVSTDFFAFQDNFKVESVPEIEDQESYEADSLEDGIVGNDEHVVSKYDDDKLPYTFLWWLAKTRKEYQQIFQPYASPRETKQGAQKNPQPGSKPSELQQQYVEHIFHIQTPFNAEELVAAPPHAKVPHKGSEIIEKFIKGDHQIRVLKADEINNENKARKSAEDQNDMVTETLAKIYIEQMLYDKAIETYQKLSLKFPEKSRYFADLVKSIEKKI
ncbi:hypothetical protein ACXZ1K_01940 [Pedobacter sp. PWIIR3]